MASGEGRAARVTRTGLALVHAGELVLPAAGSEAEAERVAEDDRASIVYQFPVEIEVVAAGVTLDADHLADLALSRLAEHLEGRV
ncbi:hypothetical protein [Micromonospora siamensis]|uniref:Uncharacterized protein n=1 Tax=Micromonospora siamensis TaxID=299152 RepID=A0A1C5J1Y7_9ACTN|nr:hypothetical protein [Micromonospora siamensis]SCG64535.1 hypothetical protein GA0074704_4035 [Micromonospora siamensis]